jgi:transcription elongation factor Elf1
MSSEVTLDQSEALLAHLHVCIHCGHSRTREDVESREVSSGILHCAKCGLDGPLNIEIRDLPA